MNLKDLIYNDQPILLDGGMGSLLFKKLPNYSGCFELLNAENPDIIKNIHTEYFEAGSNIVETNSFGGSKLKLAEYGLESRCSELNEKAAANARAVADKYSGFAAGSMGPIGLLIEPMGDTPCEEIYESYKEQALALERGGADLIIIETMTDIQEAKLALLAAKEAVSLPIICSMTFELGGKTATGTDMFTAFTTLSAHGAGMVGTNCGMGPAEIVKIFKNNLNLLKDNTAPLCAWSNAGLPIIENGKTFYPLSPEAFAAYSIELISMGIKLIGGCCGTTPEHIKALSKLIKEKNITTKTWDFKFNSITSRTKTVNISNQSKPIIIGERLNPSARKKFAEELLADKYSFLREESKKQVEEGADVLDINVGCPNIDEISAIKKCVKILSNHVDLPLMIDSSDPAVLEKALLLYPGIAIVNSINGKTSSIESILPLIKKYGCFIVILCLDENGIFKSSEKRIEIGEKIIAILTESGISKDRFLVDPLMLAESAEPGSAVETLKVIKHFSNKGIKTSIGLSNVSYGLPERKYVNNTFFKLAVQNGLTAAIANPISINEVIDSSKEKFALDFIEGRDPDANAYIKAFKSESPAPAIKETTSLTPAELVYKSIVEGNSEDITEYIDEAIKTIPVSDLLTSWLLAGLEKVGELYATGEYFLPQMIASANAMKKGFLHLKPLLANDSSLNLGKAIICTVKGDVHDIGKNIVAMMMENHGFEIVDLGKDVDSDLIIDTALNEQANVICLSSLLTTTMGEMKTICEKLRSREINIPVMIGGAVVNKSYADSIGAYYAHDPIECVKVLKVILK
jgi:5-methyltetrahydrofolate--homocysteine methyltransferase